MSPADLNVLEALVKTEHWGEFKNWKQELLDLFEDHRAMQKRITELAVARIDAVAEAYHEGARDMRSKCGKALAEGSHGVDAISTVLLVNLPERTLSLL